MQKGLTIALLLFCFLGVTLQAQTFSPIHPGSLHVDEFSPLDNDRVSVPSFTVGNFGAAVLDFQSLNAATPVSVDIAGGLNFQGEEVKFFSQGDITLRSEVNDLTVNAVQGNVLFQSSQGGVSTTAYYGDVSLDSGSNTNLEASSGSVNFDAAAFLLNGRADEHGVSITTNNKGNVAISAGQAKDWITSQVNFAGYDVTFELQSTTNFAANNADLYLVAGNNVEVSASTIAISSGAGVDVVADVSNILIEADGSMAISANELQLLSSNSQSYASVSGDIVISSTTTSYYQALDTVSLNGVNSGVYVSAKINISAVAGNNVLLNSDGPLSIGSTEFALTSEKDQYVLDTDGDTSISAQSSIRLTTLGDFDAEAQNEYNINARGVTYSVQVDSTLKSEDSILIKSAADSTFSSNNLYIDGLDGLSFYGNSLDISAARDIFADSGLNIDIFSSNDVKFTFEDDGFIIGRRFITLATNGTSTISSGPLAVTANHGVNALSKNQLYTISSNSASALFLSTRDTTFYGGYVTLESLATQIGGRTFTNIAETNITLTAANIIALQFISTYESHVNNYVASAANQFTMNVFSEFYATSDSFITFDSSFDVDSLILLKTGNDATFSAGDAFLYGSSWLLTSTNDAHFFARDTFSLTSGAITFRAKSLAFNSDGIFDYYTTNLTLTARDTYFTANDAFGGDITFASSGTLNVTSTNTQIISDATIIKSTVSTNFNTTFSNIIAQSSNVDLISGGQFTHSSGESGTGIYAGDSISVGADQGISISSLTYVRLTTGAKQDANFTSGGNLSIKANTTASFSSQDITFDSVEKGVISYGTSYSASAGDDASFLSDDYIKFVASSTADATISGPSAVSGDDSASIYGGALNFNTNNEIINANGGGARFYSVADTTFTSSNPGTDFTVGAYELTSYYALNGSVDIVAGSTFSITGGASRYTSGVNNTISITGTIDVDMSTFNHGNFTFYSDHDFKATIFGSIAITGIPGLDSTITSTHNDSDICLKSDFLGSTSFTAGRDMEIYAYGEEGFLQAYSDRNTAVTATDGSINLLSEGYQTDPQYLLNDTFGILLRTTHEDTNNAGINLESTSGSINFFSLANTSLIARNGANSYSASNRIDIRTTFYDADILVQTTQGTISYAVGSTSTFISGTPSIRADTQVNATGTSTWSGTTGVNIHQLSSIQDPSDSAIIFEAYHKPMLLKGTKSASFSAQDGGKIFVEGRNGDINFTSQNYIVNSITGAVEMEGRTSAQITAGTTVSLSAAGATGTILIATPGGNDVLFNTTTTDILFTSTIGEIDFVATTGINTQSGNDTTFSGPCVHLYGGGSLNLQSVNKISVTAAANAIAFDAEVDFTVDATTSILIDGVGGVFPVFRVNAGGSATNDGLSLTANGDIIYTTQRNVNNYNSLSSISSNSNIVFTVVSNINITSHGDSATDTSVVFEAQTGNVNIFADDFLSRSSTVTTVTSEGLIRFNTIGTTVSGARGVVYRSNTMTITTDSFTSDAPNQFYTSHSGSILFTATTGSININSDSELLFNSNGGISVTAGDVITFSALKQITSQTPGALTLSSNVFVSNSEEGTEFDAQTSITLTSPTSATFNASPNGIVLTAVSNIAYQSIATLKVVGNSFSAVAETGDVTLNAATLNLNSYQLTVDSGNDLTITSVNAQIVGPSQAVSYIAHDDITITSNTQTYNADQNLYIISNAGVDNYNKAGININLKTITVTTPQNTGIVSVDSRGDININSPIITSFTGVTGPGGVNSITRITSTGESGVVFSASTAFTHTTTNNLKVTATEGGINFLTKVGTLTLNSFNDLLMTAHNQGSVRLTGLATGSFNAKDFFVGPPTDAGVIRGAGNVTYTASSISLLTGTASFSSADDFLFTADTSGTLTGKTAFTVVGNRRQEFSSRATSITSSLLATLKTTGSYADLLVDTTTFSTTASTGTFADSSNGLVLLESGNNVFASAATTLTLDSDDNALFRADSSFISFNSPTININSVGTFTVNAGTDSIISSYTTYSLTAGKTLNARAQGTIYMSNYVQTSGVTTIYDSAGDYIANAPVITANCQNLAVQTAGEGDITASAANFLLESTGSSLSITSFGNMGSLGGTYVLSDDQLSGDKTSSYNFYTQRLTNENTDGVEFYSVSGSVDVTADGDITLRSEKGNIEFRAIRDIRYDSPQDLTAGRAGQTRIDFFAVGVQHGTFVPGNPNWRINHGFLERIPFARSVDYCGGVLDCVGLSTMLTDIIYTMLAYNLVTNDVGGTWVYQQGGP